MCFIIDVLMQHEFCCVNLISVVHDDSKLPDDSEEVLKPNKMVGGLIPSRDIVSLLD